MVFFFITHKPGQFVPDVHDFKDIVLRAPQVYSCTGLPSGPFTLFHSITSDVDFRRIPDKIPFTGNRGDKQRKTIVRLKIKTQ